MAKNTINQKPLFLSYDPDFIKEVFASQKHILTAEI